jgi:carbon storage regulator
MLVVSRKNGQRIMINDNIVITVVESKYGQCKIAIEADKDVKIYREEIYLQIKLANLMGTNAKVSAVDSVSELIKDSTNLNDKKIDNESVTEEVVGEDKKPQSIRINKKHEGY